jgi:hypothetical protein
VLLLYPGPHLADAFRYGDDFKYFYDAAGHFLSGRSPYLEPGFIPLPSALIAPLALHSLPYHRAAAAYSIINGLLVACVMLWLFRALRLNLANSALVMLITLTYGPAYSSIGEGNLDVLMLVLLVATCARNSTLRATAWGLSIATKFYSLLLLPVWAVQRRWREILIGLAVFTLVLLPFAPYVGHGFHSVTHRTATLRIVGNQSPAVLFIQIFGVDHKWLWRGCYLLLWAGTLLPRLLRDARADGRNPESGNHRRWQTLHYLPWMASAPVLVFYYTSVILLPFIALLVAINQERPLRRVEWLSVVGFILTGLYAWVFNSLLPAPSPTLTHSEPVLRALTPLGISLLLIGCAVAAFHELRSHSSRKLAKAVES